MVKKMIKMKFILLQLMVLLLVPKESEGKVDNLVTVNNDFGLKLYNKLVETKQGNIIFSPLSISLAFAMTSLGAKGQTLKEIRSTLARGFKKKQIHEQFQQLVKDLPRNDEFSQVSIANKLYVQNGFEIISSFLKSCQKIYDSDIESVDFSKSKQCASLINQWMSQKTNKKIKRIVNPSDFDSYSRVFLINALYFKAQWDSLFKKKWTKPQLFYTTPQNPVKANFLHDPGTTALYGVHKTLHFEVLEKAFKSDDFSFGIILPMLAETSLQEVEKSLSASELESLTLSSVYANLTIPKFKIESSFDLADNLQKLGIRDLFIEGKADLSGMEKSKNLYISKAVHKAVVEIDEAGAVAAAATAVEISFRMAVMIPDQKITFRADHPFLFYIKHYDSGSILFLGRYAHP